MTDRAVQAALVLAAAAGLIVFLFPLGWALLLMGERILSGWPFAPVLSGLGVLALLALAGWSLLPAPGRPRQADAQEPAAAHRH